MNPLNHYIIPQNENPYTIQSISAVVADMTDKAIVQAALQYAKEAGITDLYMMDKQFLADAIREKLERKNQNKTTRQIPVFCKDCGFSVYNECSGLRKCRSQKGLYRVVEDNEFCSWGEPKEED